jgi:hypothetical protein
MAPGSGRIVPAAAFAALVILAIACSTAAAAFTPLPDGSNDFNSPGFVVRHAWVKFALIATRPVRGQISRPDEDADVARFFTLNGLIAQQERIAGDPQSAASVAADARAASACFRDERAGLKNTVATILAGRLTRVIKEAGLTRHIGGDVVWPPVNIEFQDPPAVLVKSPRAEIKKQSESLLQGDLPIARVQQIEADAERDGKTSALVVEIGGIAMYPAIIPFDEDYHFILQDIAHEWMHQYLYFAPLGRGYFDSAKLTTLNETVANMVGRELGDMLFAEYPLAQPPSYVTIAPIAGSGAAGGDPAPGIDFTMEMRDLRRQVESLLAAGKIDEAERAMEEKRQFLAANGYYIRRLNQAYFAFNGSYADSAGSIDPIGPKLDDLRKKSASLREFVSVVREFGSEVDLDRALGTK